jgi:hypothetical protein
MERRSGGAETAQKFVDTVAPLWKRALLTTDVGLFTLARW